MNAAATLEEYELGDHDLHSRVVLFPAVEEDETLCEERFKSLDAGELVGFFAGVTP